MNSKNKKPAMDYEEELRIVSSYTQKAVNSFNNCPSSKQKNILAMSWVIYCDTIRLSAAFDGYKFTHIPSEERPSIHRLLWMVDIVSKLYEMQKWYHGIGNKLLLEISTNEESTKEKIKEIKSLHDIAQITEFQKYRNKIGAHYDEKALNHLHQFGKNRGNFSKLVLTFVDFSRKWMELTNSLINRRQ